MLFLIGCVPDLLTVYPVGDGSYGVEPSGDCCVLAAVAIVLVLGILFVFAGSLANR